MGKDGQGRRHQAELTLKMRKRLRVGGAMESSRRQFLRLAASSAALPLTQRVAIAQDAYPSRPIHIVVGFTPGAAADVTGRLLADGMGRLLGQQIVVENKPGAGSSIAADYVAHAAKDGYTLFLATLSIISNQIINPNPAFDLTRDLAPIALLSSGAVVLVVNPELNINSVAELIALAKSKPGEVMHATVMGSLPHLASELFAQRAGIKLMQVPYQGSPHRHAPGERQKKERSGLQSACDELIEKGAIITGE
jgi:tripartite-type tricarboxylate transporter receptor subunit TctC